MVEVEETERVGLCLDRALAAQGADVRDARAHVNDLSVVLHETPGGFYVEFV